MLLLLLYTALLTILVDMLCHIVRRAHYLMNHLVCQIIFMLFKLSLMVCCHKYMVGLVLWN